MIYKQHPLSAAFPAMQPDEYQSLVDSITTIGVQNPITLLDGMVIDGWHRYQAAISLGMDCPTVELDDTDPRDFVLAQNKARRNLTASQRADAVTSVYQWAPAHREKKGAVTAPLSKTNVELAAIAGTGVRSIQQAKAVHAGAIQAVQDAVKTGAVSVETAAAIAQLPAKDQKKIAAKGPEAMRAAAKPEPVPPQDEYTELDAARDQIEELQAMLAVANLGSADPAERLEAANLIAELHAEVRQLRVNLKAVTTSRDSLMNELAMVKRQCVSLQAQLKKLQPKA